MKGVFSAMFLMITLACGAQGFNAMNFNVEQHIRGEDTLFNVAVIKSGGMPEISENYRNINRESALNVVYGETEKLYNRAAEHDLERLLVQIELQRAANTIQNLGSNDADYQKGMAKVLKSHYDGQWLWGLDGADIMEVQGFAGEMGDEHFMIIPKSRQLFELVLPNGEHIQMNSKNGTSFLGKGPGGLFMMVKAVKK